MTREAFKELFDHCFDELRNYIYYRSGDAELATDIAQDTFLKLWEKRSKIFPGKEKNLLYKIAGDLFVSQYRKSRTVTEHSDSLQVQLQFEKDDYSPEEMLMFEELQKNYEKALLQLPEKQRIVFLMSRIDQMKYHEIAERLGLSVKAVEKRMTLALAYFRKVIDN